MPLPGKVVYNEYNKYNEGFEITRFLKGQLTQKYNLKNSKRSPLTFIVQKKQKHKDILGELYF